MARLRANSSSVLSGPSKGANLRKMTCQTRMASAAGSGLSAAMGAMIVVNSSVGMGMAFRQRKHGLPATMRQLPAGADRCVQAIILSDCRRRGRLLVLGSERNFHDHFRAMVAR